MSHHGSSMQTTPQMSLNSNPQATSNISGGSSGGGSSKDPKAKKRAAKSERNEKTIDVQSIEGFCGHETVETLLSYIDGDKGNSGNQKNHPKNGLLASQTQLLNSDEKKKKMVAKNKEKVNKLKKSNSMDELCSTGRQQQVKEEQSTVTANKITEDTSAVVTLRSKSSIMKKSLDGKDGKENKQQQQSKRNERRSWGTEGLSWPDSNVILPTVNNHEDQRTPMENETSSSSSSSGVQLDIQETNSASSITKTPIVASNSSVSGQTEMTTISAEAEKFQLVSKKRKVKRKSSEASEFKTSLSSTTPVVNNNNNNNLYSMTRGGRGNESNVARTDFRSAGTKSTAHTNEAASNNRNESRKKTNHDAKQTVTASQNTSTTTHVKQQSAKSRRKSTSSMPHSEEGEEGEYSDGGDSVQSLPIETTKTTSSLLSAPPTTITNNPPLPTPTTNLQSSAENKSSSKKNPIEHKQLQLAPQQQVVQQVKNNILFSS